MVHDRVHQTSSSIGGIRKAGQRSSGTASATKTPGLGQEVSGPPFPFLSKLAWQSLCMDAR